MKLSAPSLTSIPYNFWESQTGARMFNSGPSSTADLWDMDDSGKATDGRRSPNFEETFSYNRCILERVF